MALTTFAITVAPNGTGPIEVGGEDLSGAVTGFQLTARAHGGPPQLVLSMVAEGTIEGAAEVTVTRGADLADFFSNIDAEQLEAEALGRLEGFDDPRATQAILDVLREWAAGAPR